MVFTEKTATIQVHVFKAGYQVLDKTVQLPIDNLPSHCEDNETAALSKKQFFNGGGMKPVSLAPTLVR